MRFSTFVAALLPVGAVFAETWNVTVGGNNTLTFNPTSVNATNGDTIAFTLYEIPYASVSAYNLTLFSCAACRRTTPLPSRPSQALAPTSRPLRAKLSSTPVSSSSSLTQPHSRCTASTWPMPLPPSGSTAVKPSMSLTSYVQSVVG